MHAPEAVDGPARPVRAVVPSARLVLLALVVVDAAVVALHLLNGATGLDKRLFDLDMEQNLPTWVSSVQLFCVGLCGALAGRLEAGRARLAWIIFAGVFLFLSLDEGALLHEELVDRVSDSSGDAWFWPLLYTPLAVAVLAALAVVGAQIRADARALAGLVGGLLLLGGSLVLDSAATQWVQISWLFAVGVVLEEALELGGSALLVAAIVSVLASRAANAPPAVAPGPTTPGGNGYPSEARREQGAGI